MVQEADSMAEGEIEEVRVWIPRETLVNGGGAVYVGQKWSDSDIEYVRTHTERPAPNTRQRAERAALRVCEEFGLVEKYTLQAVADIIAAEFDK